MPTADQIKALLASHADGDEAQFFAVAMQIAAAEARQGHGKVAEELRALIDKAKTKGGVRGTTPIPIAKPRGELADILSASYPKTKLSDMVLAEALEKRLSRVVREHVAIRSIRSKGLSPRRKLLLVGKPGTGKTLTASALAGELGLPLFVVRLDGLITKFMGETSAKLRLIFDAMDQTRGVYLFDEFDSIGSERGFSNDVGEIRRIVNSFLQMVELDESDSLVIAATNHIDLLDQALFRRFDDIIEFDLPDQERIKSLLRSRLAGFKTKGVRWAEVAKTALGLSYAEVVRATEDAIKTVLIEDRDTISNADLMAGVRERRYTLTGSKGDF
ncbi:ATP-binding protein [Marivibrio halodurans]|uniref:ATP-binding protein n=1 Tax=Marivibrio halodurans TaxID=2039722 RepID=A0A8J7V1U1_9PROT|nr:ATP-binding protein [Marivibrio halodurans]MBP5856695.1 ATP-binding protein [Marivibrio halodurans]